MSENYEAIRSALAEAKLGDSSVFHLMFADPATFDARLQALLTGWAQHTDGATADDLAMAANLRAILRRIDSALQSNRIQFIDDLKSILTLSGSGSSNINTYFGRLSTPRITKLPSLTLRIASNRISGSTTITYTGPNNNSSLIAGYFTAVPKFSSMDNDIIINPTYNPQIYTPATPAAIGVLARPGDNSTVVEAVNGGYLSLDPKMSTLSLSYSSNLTNNPTRQCLALQVLPNSSIGDYDYSFDIYWTVTNNSGGSQTHGAYITVIGQDIDGTSHWDTYLLSNATLASSGIANGHSILRVARQAGLVYFGLSPVYLP